MLHKSAITNIEIYSPAWDKFRIGKFTSSKIVALMPEKGIGSGGMTYIYQKASEFLIGQTLAEEEAIVEDENTVWGLENEIKALDMFCRLRSIKYLVMQKLIHVPGTHFSSTPDALHILDSSVFKEDCYNVATVEVKCPRKFPRFLELYRCNTPMDIFKAERKYFWQVIDQMLNCDSAIGYLGVFHPLFPFGKNMKIIEFKKLDLWDKFKLLEERKGEAVTIFEQLISEFKA